MLTSSLPLALLSPDQAPAAVQLVALVVDQVMVTELLSVTDADEDERLTVGAGVAWPPLTLVASPPPPPQAEKKTKNEHKTKTLIYLNPHILKITQERGISHIKQD